MSSQGADTLVFDVSSARRLASALSAAEDEVLYDQLALRTMLADATALLRVDHTSAVVRLGSARRGFAALATDLRWRLGQIDRTHAALAGLDELSTEIDDWRGPQRDPQVVSLRERRRRSILDLVDGDLDHASRVEAAIAAGATALQAFQTVHAEIRLEDRVERLMAVFPIDETGALAMIERVDGALAELSVRGFSEHEALSAVALVENFGLDLDMGLAHASAGGIGLLDALGEMLTAQSLGVSLREYVALRGLHTHFEVFDNATGGETDQRVSVGDLDYVVSHPLAFTPAQVVAAKALLAEPLLRNRLDTADSNNELFEGDRFGSTERGDGLIADVDLRAFMLKTQLHQLLGDYADEIDIANDPSGVVDGFRSQNDFREFIAGNPQLPESVLAAAQVALDAGWFDESWWQEHKDELAMGAALLAAGVAVVATGGGASMLLVVGVGAFAAGGTTIAVNLATGAPMLDDAFTNAMKGGFIGAGVHGVTAGYAGYATASTGLGRVAAVAGLTSGAADVVAAGGIDLVLTEEHEERIHETATTISTVTGAVDLAYNAGEWSTRRMATFETVDDQLAALSPTISRQKQLRHLSDSGLHSHGGYFDDPADAQRVLDAVRDGSADVIGITRGNDLLVRYDAVTGTHLSERAAASAVESSTFVVKGTAAVSVFPTRPGRID